MFSHSREAANTVYCIAVRVRLRFPDDKCLMKSGLILHNLLCASELVLHGMHKLSVQHFVNCDCNLRCLI